MVIKKPYKSNPYLNNNLTAKEFFNERQKFEKLFPKGYGFPQTINFWESKSLFYGLMDQKKNLIIPDPFYLKQIKDSRGNEQFVLNFVADAFNDFQRFMNLDMKKKFVDDGSIIKKDIVAEKGWKDYQDVRLELDDQSYNSFIGTVMKTRHTDVRDIEDFIEIFSNDYIETIIETIPFTIQGLIQNKFIGSQYSGLCVEIDKTNKSDGYQMFKSYINNYNFKTYLMTAAKFGFIVDKNVPYRLVANLGSPKMLAYAEAALQNYLSIVREAETGLSSLEWTGLSTVSPSQEASGYHTHVYKIDEYGNGYTDHVENPFNPGKINHRHQIVNFKVQEAQGWDYIDKVAYGIQPHTHDLKISQNPVPFTIDRMFEAFFSEVGGEDVIRIKNLIFNFYNRYVTQHPTAVKQVLCDRNKNLSVTATVQRNTISQEEFDKKFEMLTFLKMYFIIRLKELKAKLPDAVIRANIRKIENLYFTIDSARSLRYIQEYLKQFY